MTDPTRKPQTARDMADSLIAAMRAAGKKEAPAKDIDGGSCNLFYEEMRHLLQLMNKCLNQRIAPNKMLMIIRNNTGGIIKYDPKQEGWNAKTKALWDGFAEMHEIVQSYHNDFSLYSAHETYNRIEAAKRIAQQTLARCHSDP